MPISSLTQLLIAPTQFAWRSVEEVASGMAKALMAMGNVAQSTPMAVKPREWLPDNDTGIAIRIQNSLSSLTRFSCHPQNDIRHAVFMAVASLKKASEELLKEPNTFNENILHAEAFLEAPQLSGPIADAAVLGAFTKVIGDLTCLSSQARRGG